MLLHRRVTASFNANRFLLPRLLSRYCLTMPSLSYRDLLIVINVHVLRDRFEIISLQFKKFPRIEIFRLTRFLLSSLLSNSNSSEAFLCLFISFISFSLIAAASKYSSTSLIFLSPLSIPVILRPTSFANTLMIRGPVSILKSKRHDSLSQIIKTYIF